MDGSDFDPYGPAKPWLAAGAIAVLIVCAAVWWMI
jgi:Na+/melibiose symporter-like transporter